ncbi:SCO family protein [Gammaproteobacteria bacterium AH-315-E17]|nr:SCO family protein [Gammaproteobacteria bacterium AH-315-E17]
MNKQVTNTIISCVAFIALVSGLTLNRILSPAVMTNELLAENGLFVYDAPRRISNFSLIDHSSNAVDLELLRDKWTLIFFGYTYCPDVCPLTMATLNQFSGLLEAEGNYAEDTQVIMVTVDPQRDTVEKLSDYVGFFNDDYLGLTGEYIDIFNFASQLNIAFVYVPGVGVDYLVSHSGEIALINPNGHFHGFFKVPHDPEKMAENYAIVRAAWN